MNSFKKSLLIPGDFPPEVSGIATYFLELWKYYSSNENFILAAKYAGYKEYDRNSDLNTIRVAIPTGNAIHQKIFKSFIYTFKTVQLHLRHKFDLLHCGQVLSSGATGWIMKKMFGIPYIVYVYGSETYRFGENKFLMEMIRRFLSEALYIIPNSHFTMEEFQALNISREKFRIITPGVDVERFHPEDPDENLIAKYGLAGKKVLLTVARLDERKGHDRVIETIARLKDDQPNIVYLIVGKGREMQRLQQLVKHLNIERQVVFCGYVPDSELPKYYNLCDIFLLLNRQTYIDEKLSGDYEGFGIVFLEASACGKAVIAGNFGGIADAVDHEHSGYIIDSENPREITKTIKSLLNKPEKLKEIGDFGRQRAIDHFTWKSLSKKLIEAIGN